MPKFEDWDAAHVAWSAGYKNAMLDDDPRVELLRRGYTKEQIEHDTVNNYGICRRDHPIEILRV